jgi:hypothetical protein
MLHQLKDGQCLDLLDIRAIRPSERCDGYTKPIKDGCIVYESGLSLMLECRDADEETATTLLSRNHAALLAPILKRFSETGKFGPPEAK